MNGGVQLWVAPPPMWTALETTEYNQPDKTIRAQVDLSHAAGLGRDHCLYRSHQPGDRPGFHRVQTILRPQRHRARAAEFGLLLELHTHAGSRRTAGGSLRRKTADDDQLCGMVPC